MDNSKSSRSELAKWRARYEKLRKDMAGSETHHQQNLSLLNDVINELQATSRFENSTLSAALAKFLASIREGKSSVQLNTQSEALFQQLRQLKNQDKEKHQEVAATLIALLNRLEQLSQDVAFKKRTKTLSREISRAANKHRETLYGLNDTFLRRYAELILDDSVSDSMPMAGATQHQIAGESRGPGWWRRLLGRMDSTGNKQVEAQETVDQLASNLTGEEETGLAPDDLLANEELAAKREITESTKSEGPTSRVELDFSQSTESLSAETSLPLGEISAIILGMLADIHVPEAAKEQALQLYKRLEQEIEDGDVVSILDDTAEIVSLTLRRDQADFEGFLRHLDTRLLEFNQYVISLGQQLGEADKQSEQLDKDVSARVSNIRESLSQASSLEALKTQVGSNIDQVSGFLDTFMVNQKQRIVELEEQTNSLQSQVGELQKESEQSKQALTLQREKLLRDKLTQIPNREAYEQRITDEFARWKRYQAPLSLAVADIDKFKMINDTYGHAAGDKVLALVAKIMQSNLRDTDFIARYGGEEFTIILPSTSMENAKIALNKVREAIERSPFNFNKQPVVVTSSFGVTEFSSGDSVEAVFNRADAS